jgi:ribbon-helix-helix CopG family protein
MAIAPMPGRKPHGNAEAAATKFIEGASASARIVPPGEARTTRDKRKPAMIRFDSELLARVDQAARRRGISRSAWIAFTLSKALDDER